MADRIYGLHRFIAESLRNEDIMANKKKKRRMKVWQKALLFFAELVVLCVVVVAWYIVDKFSKLEIQEIDREAIDLVIAPEVKANETLKGYTNYLLLGTDARDNSLEALNKTGEGNTDAIIIASLNNDTKEVKLVSVYRDTLLMVPASGKFNDTYRKATEAFFYSGVEATISMVNLNLDLNITDYVMVNFEALIRIVDAMGGVDLEITEEELYWLNEYLRDTGLNTGRTYTTVPSSGMVHLDGIQATAYCRIRYADGTLDYGRAERQRKIISLIFEKAKKMNITQLTNAINGVLDNVVTSVPASEILSMVPSVFDFSLVDQTGFPFEKFGSMKKVPEINIADPVFAMTLESNVSELHKYLFGVDNYEPTSRIKDISAYLQALYDKNYYPANIYQ